MRVLRFILGDQLSHTISSLKHCDKKNDILFLCEVHEEATYVKHHPKKIALIFSAMRHFAKELSKKGFIVDYVKLDNPNNTHSFQKELQRAIQRHKPYKVLVTHPGEYRVFQALKNHCTFVEDDRFLCSLEAFSQWASSRKQLRMEYFYRELRKKQGILIKAGKPVGGQWNYDHANRKALKSVIKIPKPPSFKPDLIINDVIKLIKKNFKNHFGKLEPFTLAVTRNQALKVLKNFINKRLANFGAYQDAMLEGQPWLYHSQLSFYLNCGLLLPKECIDAALAAYENKQAPLNSVEGFIRQILGWREYVRGIYWLKMPSYKKTNYLKAKQHLPDFFWTAETNMNCLKQCIKDTQENAYAHHIQRLMVIGNFALLCGINPIAVNEWYLIVYADAYEWVELPNVNGMILFADGGLLASKPYAASGAYINKMSDYCKNCHYKVFKKNGDTACPFNYLYWDFLIRNKPKLKDNQRLKLIYKRLASMNPEKLKLIQTDSKRFLQKLFKQTTNY